jgi:hypothetical protein
MRVIAEVTRANLGEFASRSACAISVGEAVLGKGYFIWI